jgi:secondary thiamine-phosphate synthase enzyme
MKLVQIVTAEKDQVIDITDTIQKISEQEHFGNGICSITVLHTTCALTTICLDPGTDLDFLDAIRRILPHIQYRHQHDPSHTPDHILSSLIGPSVTLPVHNGELLLGTWQRVVLVELDGPRERTISVTLLLESK